MDNYPPGAANDPNAPYNQPDGPEPIEVDTTVCITLSHTGVPVTISDYTEEFWEDFDVDDEGHPTYDCGSDPDFSNTNFNKAYLEDSINIIKLLEEYATLLDKKHDEFKKKYSEYKEEFDSLKGTATDPKKLAGLSLQMSKLHNQIISLELKIDMCRNWVIDDVDVEQE